MLWTAPPGGGEPDLGFSTVKEGSMQSVVTASLDIAKNVFQARGVDA